MGDDTWGTHMGHGDMGGTWGEMWGYSRWGDMGMQVMGGLGGYWGYGDPGHGGVSQGPPGDTGVGPGVGGAWHTCAGVEQSPHTAP